jgi:hypothetical protein
LTLLFFATEDTKGELSEYQVIRRAGYQESRLSGEQVIRRAGYQGNREIEN